MKKTEKELLTELEKNSHTALEDLMTQYTGLVWDVVKQYLANPEDIEECVNDVFWNFYMHKNRYLEEKGSLSSYLAGIARKKAISFYRKNKKHIHKELSDEGTTDVSGEWDNTLLDRILLDQAMKILSPEDFRMVRMKFYYGMTNREIADIMMLPYETVKKRNQRSLIKLRQVL